MAIQTDPGGGDPSIPPDAPASRAAEVLDALVREQAAGSDQHSGPGGRVGAARLGVTWPHLDGWPRGMGPGAILAVLLAVAVVVVVVWRRPAPIEDRLPIASAVAGDETSGDASGDRAVEPPAARQDSTGQDSTGPDSTGQDSAGGGSSTSVAAELVVHVAGAVAAPGVVRLGAGSRVTDAVSAAGGLRPDADPDRVNLAAPLTDGQRVVVPILGQPVPAEVLPSGSAAGPGGGAASGGADGSPALIDINTATESQLEELPGVGPATAAAIVAHRESEGAFATVDSLLDVRGIGEAKLDALRDLVTVGAAQ